MVVGRADCRWRIPRNYWVVIDLGPRTSCAVLHDFHAAAMEELASERRLHHRGIFNRARASLCRQSLAFEFHAALANDRRRPAFDPDCGLHRLFIRAGEGARPLAESFAAT